MEERIITSLTAQIFATHAALARQSGHWTFNERLPQEANYIGIDRQLQLKVDDLENRSRRCKICKIGIPEGAESNQPTLFIKSCLGEILAPGAFSYLLTVDRAHNLAVQRRQDSAPRPFIACIHHFQLKQGIMQLAREKGPLLYRCSEIHIYPDYSAEVGRKTAAFAPV